MTSAETRIIHTSINRPFAEAYDFAHRPENFPSWAAGMSSSLHKSDDGWVAETPEGEATVRFSERNDYGVIDHWVQLPGKPEIYIPLRMIANGDATEVELVLFRLPDMTDVQFEADAAAVTRDLATLKAVIEKA